MKKTIITLFAGGALALTLAGAPAPAAAQRYVQLDGRVQWIAGQKLMLLLNNGGGIAVDIARVPLDQYRTLTQGDPVVVVGTVSRDNRRVFGSAVMRDNRGMRSHPSGVCARRRLPQIARRHRFQIVLDLLEVQAELEPRSSGPFGVCPGGWSHPTSPRRDIRGRVHVLALNSEGATRALANATSHERLADIALAAYGPEGGCAAAKRRGPRSVTVSFNTVCMHHLYVTAPAAAPGSVSKVWLVDTKGPSKGHLSLIPGSSSIVAPDGVTIDPETGYVYIADLAGGAIWRVIPGGSAQLWSSDALLHGNPSSPLGAPAGPNGVKIFQNAVYAGITDYGRVVKIPINADGAAGAVSVVFEDPSLALLDDMEMDDSGNMYLALLDQNKLVKVTPAGVETTLATAADGLDLPVNMALTKDNGRTVIYLTNLGLGGTGAGPTVMKITVSN